MTEDNNISSLITIQALQQNIKNIYTLLNKVIVNKDDGNYNVNIDMEQIADIVSNNSMTILQRVYPVGSVYTSFNNTNPEDIFGFGTWEQITDKFLYCSSGNSGETGGSKKITVNNLPSHSHKFSGNNISGSFYLRGPEGTVSWGQGCFNVSASGEYGYGHSNNGRSVTVNFNATPSGTISNTGDGTDYMPPYMTVYCWKRTA